MDERGQSFSPVCIEKPAQRVIGGGSRFSGADTDQVFELSAYAGQVLFCLA